MAWLNVHAWIVAHDSQPAAQKEIFIPLYVWCHENDFLRLTQSAHHVFALLTHIHFLTITMIAVHLYSNVSSFHISLYFYVKIVEKNADPEEMLLAYLRRKGMVIAIWQTFSK